jgi:hypothetical protein
VIEAPKEAYPLTWPSGQVRTPPTRRKSSQFKVTFGQARQDLLYELHRLGASKVIVSTDVPLRRDGLPYADGDPEDPAVAVYFDRKSKPFVIACDNYESVRENLRAVGETVKALRAIERHGSSSMMEQAFTGFAALPAARAADPPWYEVLGVDRAAGLDELYAARDRLALQHHPDRGSDHDRMAQINRAFDRANEERR